MSSLQAVPIDASEMCKKHNREPNKALHTYKMTRASAGHFEGEGTRSINKE